MDIERKDLLLAIGSFIVGFGWMVAVLLMDYNWAFHH